MPKQIRKIAVVGLGYVGLPILVAFGQKQKVIGFDKNSKRIAELKNHIDRNREFSKKELTATKILYTHHVDDLKKANFYIIAVPTPITSINQPDFSYLISASQTVGQV